MRYIYFLIVLVFTLSANSVNVETVYGDKNLSIVLSFSKDVYVYRDLNKLNVSNKYINNVKLGKITYDKTAVFNHGEYIFNPPTLLVTVPYSSKVKYFELDYVVYHCNFSGFCYPPESHIIKVDMSKSSALLSDYSSKQKSSNIKVSKNSSLKQTSVNSGSIFDIKEDESGVVNLLKSDKNILFISFIFFIFGILLSFTPCVLPLIPILLAIIGGKDSNISRKRSLLITLSYIFAISLSYAFIGLVISILGKNIQLYLQNSYVLIFTSLIVFIFALSGLGLFRYNLIPNKLQGRVNSFLNKLSGGSLINAFIIGFLSTLIVSPCLVAPISGALVYILESGDILVGTTSLFFLGLGMGVVILIISQFFINVKLRANRYLEYVNKVFSIVLFAFSIYILQRVIGDEIAYILYGILLIATPFLFNALNVFKYLALPFIATLLFIFGFILIYTGFKGNNSILLSLDSSKYMQPKTNIEFKAVDNYQDLNSIIKNSKKDLLLYFRADWCVSCKDFKRELIDNSTKIAEFGFEVITIDLTDSGDSRDILMKKLHILGPPTLLFVKDKRILNDKIVGKLDISKLVSILKRYKY